MSHINMLLTMGVRDCPEQSEVYAEVMGAVKSMFWLICYYYYYYHDYYYYYPWFGRI